MPTLIPFTLVGEPETQLNEKVVYVYGLISEYLTSVWILECM